MSAGVHTGSFQCFLVGESHRELLLTGSEVSTLTDMEGAATRRPDDREQGDRGRAARRPGRRGARVRASGSAGSGATPRPTRDMTVPAERPQRRSRGLRPHRDPRPPALRWRRPRAPPGDRRVPALRRHRRAARTRRPAVRRRRARRARHRRAARRRRARGHVPRHRHRPRRRQDHPRRRRARARWATTKSGCSVRCASIADGTRTLDAPHRRAPRPDLRRRRRSGVPPDLHRHGRHREPRGAAHGPGRARPDPRDERRCSTARGRRSRPRRSSRST